MRRDRALALWFGCIWFTAGVLISGGGVMWDMDPRYVKWGSIVAGGGGGLLLLYGMLGKPKRDTPPTSDEHPD